MSRPILRELGHLAWPVLVAQLAVTAHGVVDTVMAGRLSAVDLAAVGIGFSIYITAVITCMGVLLALVPTVAHLYGARRHDEIGEQVRQSAWLGLMLAAVAMLLLAHPEPLIAFSRLTPEVEAKVRAYLGALVWAVPGALLFRVFHGLMTGIGRPRAVMVFYLGGLAFKVPLNALFMYGGEPLGLPALGSTGCAVASVIVTWATALGAWAWCARQNEFADYALFARASLPRPAALAGLLRLGIPIGGAFFVDVTAFSFMALFIARLGANVSAAHQIAANLAVVTFMIPTALGNAAGVLVGQALGGSDPARARHIGRIGLACGLVIGALVGGLLWLGDTHLAAAYSADPAVQTAASGLIALVALYHVVDAVQTVAINVLRGHKLTAAPTAIYMVALWGVGLGGGYLLAFANPFGAPLGAAGFWLAAGAGLAVAALAMVAYLDIATRAARHDGPRVSSTP